MKSFATTSCASEFLKFSAGWPTVDDLARDSVATVEGEAQLSENTNPETNLKTVFFDVRSQIRGELVGRPTIKLCSQTTNAISQAETSRAIVFLCGVEEKSKVWIPCQGATGIVFADEAGVYDFKSVVQESPPRGSLDEVRSQLR